MAGEKSSLLSDKFALFVPSLRAGGAERVMVRLANTAARLGVSVDLVVCGAEGSLALEVSSDVRLVNLGTGRTLTSLGHLVRYLRQEKPCAVLSTMAHSNIVSVWSRFLARLPCRLVIREATTLSATHPSTQSPKERAMLSLARQFYKWADSIVAPSRGVAEDLLRLHIAPQHKLHVIYNPVVTPILLEKSKEPPPHPWLEEKRCPVIIAVGRLVFAKDYPTLVRAFSKVRDSYPAKLIILGEGEERSRLQQLVWDLGLVQDVDLPGFVANPYAFMSRADVYVLSSRWEGMPNALIEALALGVPVVATDCPSGPRELLEEGRLGKLVRVGDTHEMAEAIVETMCNPPLVDVRSIHERFDAIQVTRAYLRLAGVEA